MHSMTAQSASPPQPQFGCHLYDWNRLTSEPILIRVGVAKEKFYVHGNLLRASSGFFDKALQKEWKEGQDRSVDILETDYDHFKV
jgi:hypothetical protein